MSRKDFSFAAQLADTMNWHMTEADFQFATWLEPEGCFVLFEDSQRIGIATSVSYGRIGWFGNLIVKEEYRSRGVGSLLLKHAVNYLHCKGVEAIGLYAYPHLIDFYSNFGFKQDEEFAVLHAENLALSEQEELPEIGAQNLQAIAGLDAQCFSGNRSKLLEAVVFDEGNLGYFLPEDGRVVGYIAAKVYGGIAEVGPLTCEVERVDAALRLVRTVLGKLSGLSIYLYLPKKEQELLGFLLDFGFKEEFYVARMFLGSVNVKSCIYMAESLERG